VGIVDVNRWDEFCMAESATTINENGDCIPELHSKIVDTTARKSRAMLVCLG
jgi:hypothetical protein